MIKYKGHEWTGKLQFAIHYRLLRVVSLVMSEGDSGEDVRHALALILALHLPSFSDIEPEDLVEIMKLANDVYLPNIIRIED